MPPQLPRPSRVALAATAALALVLPLLPGPNALAAPADGQVRTFDSEPLGQAPADCRVIGDVTVAEAAFGGASAGNRAMRVSDQSNTVYTRAWCDYPQSAEKSVSYRFSPAQFNAGPYVAIQGAPGTSANGVWRFTFNRDGDDIRIAAYNGSSFADVARVKGGAALNEWVDVTINATTERAELIVNGVRFETDRRNAASPTMGEVYFGSAGASPVGVDYYIDDLTVSSELPDDAFAGLEIETIFDDTGLVRGTEVVDAPVARFQLPDGADVADYDASVQFGDQTVPVTLSGPDADGWVTASISHTFARAGVGELRFEVTDAAGVRSVSSQAITVIGGLSTLTFEDDEVDSIPPQCSSLSGYLPAAVTDEKASEGQQSLRIRDTDPSKSVGVTCTALPQQGGYLSFQLNPTSTQGLTFDLIGQSLLPTGQPANSLFRFAVRADGGIQWYEQWTATWRELSPAGSVALDQWSQIEVSVPADHAAARVSINGTYVGSAGATIGNNSSRHNEVISITGIAFTTSGSGAAAVNDDVFIDDLTFGTPEITPPAALGTTPFTFGDTVVVDNFGEQVGFPSSGVVVRNENNDKRVLVPYSGHPDVDDAGGIWLGATDDGGESWFSGQHLNPMPDDAGTTITRMRNGNLFAVNYHTYMTDGTDDKEALVETAISTDGGETWIRREGAMVAPEAMRPIGLSERPGTRLGGFVLHHTVVEDPDGTMYMAAYGYYARDEGFRQVVLVSHDGGVNWNIAGTAGEADPEQLHIQAYEGPCEGAIERLADGSLLMVMRVGWRLPMLQSRSFDNGKTWTEPEEIKTGPQGQDLLSVQPTLELMPSGELMLMVGRPGLVMTISKSGLADDWTTPVGIDYANTENGGFTVLDPTTILVLGDRGRVQPWEVWSRKTTFQPSCEQTITGKHDGAVSVGAGGLCLIDATVDGPITVKDGGKLLIQNSEVTGSVTTIEASTVAICDSRVDGRVTLTGSTAAVSVGDTSAACDPATIDGQLRIVDSQGPVVVDRSTVSGNVSMTNNRGAQTVVSGLSVGGSITCSRNTVTPTDAGVELTVGGKRQGQCA
ncbi:sialidase family protein [Parenemella sanctibonifatiensis]|uniref:Sialidase domain-containing protein n=1 Tax=Parenemella sanctibonifatiensis TaxID=2016505 RepID=A0A255E9N5_9ACTN|nr:sialidase family protein [Parenemella sanctibonifatiensis]OYN88226.1 hypothetical protein CGZ92_04580 [Parenemella sanctibonifatiensis]